MSKLSEISSEKAPDNIVAPISAPLRSHSEFSLEQRRILLGIAHQAILCALQHRPFEEAPLASAELAEPRGVFTTLHLRGAGRGDVRSHLHSDLHDGLHRDTQSELHLESHRQLRGCVGYALPIAPLHRAVAETARAAAFDDSRFSPVTLEEAPRLEVSLSVLSHLFPIHPEAVEVGRHGLLISQGAHRGLLLPQVPVEQNWDRKTFLDQTCRKAGLPLSAWRRDATIEAFSAEVFGDSDIEAAG
jgi:AmmeMemoRadiSam system protein A